MKRVHIIIGIVIAVLLVIAIVVGFGLWFLFGGFLPSPPKPEITHGEFPFRLVYEINGETKVVEDVLICEYDGFGANAARGKYRQWKSYLVSGNTRITLFKSEEIEIFYTPNINHREAGAFYMGDTEIYSSINEVFPNAWRTSDFGKKQVNSYIIPADEMWEKYKIKLISWKIDPPIQNTFK